MKYDQEKEKIKREKQIEEIERIKRRGSKSITKTTYSYSVL
jgi:hypothetical protein